MPLLLLFSCTILCSYYLRASPTSTMAGQGTHERYSDEAQPLSPTYIIHVLQQVVHTWKVPFQIFRLLLVVNVNSAEEPQNRHNIGKTSYIWCRKEQERAQRAPETAEQRLMKRRESDWMLYLDCRCINFWFSLLCIVHISSNMQYIHNYHTAYSATPIMHQQSGHARPTMHQVYPLFNLLVWGSLRPTPIACTAVLRKSAHEWSILQVCQKGGWALFQASVSTCNHERAPMSCFKLLNAFRHKTVRYNRAGRLKSVEPEKHSLECYAYRLCVIDFIEGYHKVT